MQDTADGSRTLYSERYAQTFHSDKGAVTESRHVFLEASGVTERVQQGEATTVLEVGFGTGLNFFLTADLALSAGSAAALCEPRARPTSGEYRQSSSVMSVTSTTPF